MIKKAVNKAFGAIRENKALLLAAAVTGIAFGVSFGMIKEGINRFRFHQDT